MVRFYCNCCGCDFSESEGTRHHAEETEIVCPMCSAYYDEDDPNERFIERYNEEDEEDEIEAFKKSIDVHVLDNSVNAESFNAIIDSRKGIVIE